MTQDVVICQENRGLGFSLSPRQGGMISLTQVSSVMTPASTLLRFSPRRWKAKEMVDLNKAFQIATSDLKHNVTMRFARFHKLIKETSAVNIVRDEFAGTEAKAAQ